MKTARPTHIATTNACKLCSPLGASLVFRGIEGAVPFIHGSQGCSTYIRRYIISHFNEPMDIASSNFAESSAVFGGEHNLRLGLKNVTHKYAPRVIGVATTCLTETIGDDVRLLLKQYAESVAGKQPELVPVSTPSYAGTHMEGFHAAVRAVVSHFACPTRTAAVAPDAGIETSAGGLEEGRPSGEEFDPSPALPASGEGVAEFGAANPASGSGCCCGGPFDTNPSGWRVNLLPGFVSPADLRYLKEVLASFGVPFTLLPDYSDTLDGPALADYEDIPRGGTPIADIRGMRGSAATIEFGRTLVEKETAGTLLQDRFDVPLYRLGMPIGVRETDAFFDALQEITGESLPSLHANERGRLIDAYVDGHKYVSGKRAIIYGEEDMVVGLASFLAEIGIVPVLCATGGKSGCFVKAVQAVSPQTDAGSIREGVDFYEIEEEVKALAPDLLVGSSKGYSISRRLGVPLIRVGFPIHDRLGGQRLLHLGYPGAQRLFDEVVNTLIAAKQDGSPVGYSYM
ncbi:MAG: nitrogenase component 1 [Capsulimonadaceae bacterium]